MVEKLKVVGRASAIFNLFCVQMAGVLQSGQHKRRDRIGALHGAEPTGSKRRPVSMEVKRWLWPLNCWKPN